MQVAPRRLNTRIVLLVSCILLATGVASGWITARDQTTSLLATMRANSSIMVRNLAESVARTLLIQDYAELESFLLKSAELSDIRRLQVCEPDGALIWNVEAGADGRAQATTGIARLQPPSSTAAVVAIENERLVIWQPIEAGSILGWLRADFSLSAIRAAQARTWENTLLLSMLWVVCSAFLIVLVLRPMVQAIGRLTAFSMKLDEHKGERIAISGQPLEIARLGESLNEASAKLYSTERLLLDEQQRLRESEAMYRSLVTSMAEGVVFLSANGEITAVNPAAERILGRRFEQMAGKLSGDPQWKAIYQDGKPFPGELHPAMVTLSSGEPQAEVVMGIEWPDGRLVWISINSQPLIAPGESKPYAVVTTFHDITVRKNAEDALRRGEARLKDAQRIAHVGNWELDLKQNVLIWSEEIYRIFEIDPLKFQASYEGFLGAIHPEDRELVDRAYTESVANHVPYDIVHRLLMQDGRIKYVNERCETVYDTEGRAVCSMGTIHDITERMGAEEEIRKLNVKLEQRVADRTAELEAANRELEAFAFSVSHDLRAPLRHIDGFVELLQERIAGSLDEQSQHYMETITKAARRMEALIGDILSFSRMGRAEMARTRVDVGVLLQEVIRDFEPDTQGREIDWRIAALPEVQGDRAMLRVVLVNLLSNALKFTQTRARAEIEIGCAAGEAGDTVIFVRDNGVGFDMQYVGKLFGVFQRLHREEEFEGTGIGLANVRRVISRHGGRTWAEGTVNGGATFYFSLPQVPAKEAR